MQQQRRRSAKALSPVSLNNNSTRPMRQTNRNVSTNVNQCHGCSQPMYNQFISNVLNHLWHPECVRCFVCQCLLNEQCYSREGKLYCKDDFIKKYIHRCFACQNLVQSHELIRRIRAGRIYHADCFVCTKCKKILKDDDISSLFKSNETTFNDLECLCQTCLNPDKSTIDEDKTTTEQNSTTVNGNETSSNNVKEENHANEQQSMEVDEPPPVPVQITKPPISNEKENSSLPSPTASAQTIPSSPVKSKVRQNTNGNGNKRSPTKSKPTTPVSRQKQTTNERKGRSPATRSKSSNVTSTTPTTAAAPVQTRSSNRRTKKAARYRKRSFSSGSDEDETEDEEDIDNDHENDSDFTDEEHKQNDEQENPHSPVVKSKPSATSNEKNVEPEVKPTTTVQPSAPPPSTATNPSLLSQAKMSEPLSLLSGLAANPMSISSIMKPDLTASFMPPNFNPAFPTPPQFLPPGFSLPPRLPMAPPAQPPSKNRSDSESDSDSLDCSSSPLQMDISTNAEPGTPARPINSPKNAPRPSTTQKPSALSSLLEFGKIPPSTLGDIRPTTTSTNPFPFPFVTPGPGVPFSPQAAAGMATFYRPPFGVPPSAMPLDMSQSNNNVSKKKSDSIDNDEIVSQNLLDDSSSSSLSPKKKARKSNSRNNKSKNNKKNEAEGENSHHDEDVKSPPVNNKKKKKSKNDTHENGNTNYNDEMKKVTNGNLNNHSHNLLAQMGLLNNSFMPPPPPPPTSSSTSTSTTNGKNPTPNAQLAAMYNMAPHFAAYNAFPGAFNPAFAAAYAAGAYATPYGFHPAFGASPTGQPFPFMPPTHSLNPDEIVGSNKNKTKNNTSGEKKKSTTPRTNKKKSAVSNASTDLPPVNDGETNVATPESMSTPSKRHMSSTDSEDFDEQHPTNGKSNYDSDGSIGDGDHPLTSSMTTAEKKGARTTIKPQQLEILCKAYEHCSKPNKIQREQLVAETGLSLRVIQVWFQNKRSKERKGKTPKEKENPLDDDEIGEDSQSSPPPPPVTSETNSAVNNET